MGIKVPVHTFSEDEKMWYAKLLVQAALEDNEVSSTEMDYLVKVCYFLEEDKRDEIRDMISRGQKPQDLWATIPKSFDDKIKAAIFTEVALMAVSDNSFDKKERKFVKSVSAGFGFPPAYCERVLSWCDKALEVTALRVKLVEEVGLGENTGPKVIGRK